MSNDTKLIEFVFGTLDQVSRGELERELETSAQIREELAEIAEVLSLIAEAEQPRLSAGDLRARLMKSLDQETPFQGFVHRLARFFDLGKAEIRKVLNQVNAVPSAPWEANAFPGTHLLHFNGGPRVAAADCGLVYVEPGQVFPTHRHLGDEWGLILQGCKQEIGGHTYEPGDIMYKAPGSVHSYRVAGDEPLIWAAVLREGLEFVES